MSVVFALAALGAVAPTPPLPGDRLAVAAAVEVIEGAKLVSLTAHKDAVIFWDDAGTSLSEYLISHRNSPAHAKACVASNVEVAPAGAIQMQYMPKELRGGSLRELRMDIICDGGKPIAARVTFYEGTLAGLQYIVEPDVG